MACRWCRGDAAHWLTGRMSLITRIKSLTRPAASVREFRGQYLIPGILASGQIDRHIACGFLVIAHLLLSYCVPGIQTFYFAYTKKHCLCVVNKLQ